MKIIVNGNEITIKPVMCAITKGKDFYTAKIKIESNATLEGYNGECAERAIMESLR